MWCGSRRRVIINRRRRRGDTLKASTRRSMGIVGHKWRRRSGGRGGATHSKEAPGLVLEDARGNPEVYTAWNYQKLVVQLVDDELGVMFTIDAWSNQQTTMVLHKC